MPLCYAADSLVLPKPSRHCKTSKENSQEVTLKKNPPLLSPSSDCHSPGAWFLLPRTLWKTTPTDFGHSGIRLLTFQTSESSFSLKRQLSFKSGSIWPCFVMILPVFKEVLCSVTEQSSYREINGVAGTIIFKSEL